MTKSFKDVDCRGTSNGRSEENVVRKIHGEKLWALKQKFFTKLAFNMYSHWFELYSSLLHVVHCITLGDCYENRNIGRKSAKKKKRILSFSRLWCFLLISDDSKV